MFGRTLAVTILGMGFVLGGCAPAPRPADHEVVDLPAQPLPEGAVQRLGRESSYTSASRSLTFSPDGSLIASGSLDGTRLWSAATGEEIHHLPGPSTPVTAIAFGSEGKTLITFAEELGRAVIWDVKTGKELSRIELPLQRQGFGYALSADGRVLVWTTAAAGTMTAVFVDVESGKEQRRWGVGNGEWCRAALPPGGDLLAVASRSSISLWDTDTGKLVHELWGPGQDVHWLAFAPDGRTLVSAEFGSLCVWDARAGQRRLKIADPANIQSGTFSPDSQALLARVILGPTSILQQRLWNLKTGEEIPLPDEAIPPRVTAFSPDGKVLAVGGRGLSQWEWPSARQRLRHGCHEGEILSLAYSPDERTLVTGSADATVCTWDVATGRQLSWLRGHEGPVKSVAFSPDETTLASAGEDQVIRLWSASTGKLLHRLVGHQKTVNSIAFAPDGRTLVSGSDDCTLREWEVATGRELRRHEWPVGYGYPPNGRRGDPVFEKVKWVSYAPEGRSLLIIVNGNASEWDPKKWQPLAGGKGLGTCTSAALTPDGSLLAAAGFGLHVRNHLGDQGQRMITKEFLHWKQIAFSPDGKRIASLDENTLRFWDVATGQEVVRLEEPGHSPVCMAFSPSGRTLAIGHHGSSVLVWDVRKLLSTRRP